MLVVYYHFLRVTVFFPYLIWSLLEQGLLFSNEQILPLVIFCLKTFLSNQESELPPRSKQLPE